MSRKHRPQLLRIMVTAGPTREYLDPVRFITNQSTGTIGYLLAAAAQRRGHEVHLLSGPTTLSLPRGVHGYRFETANQLKSLALRLFPRVDAVIAAAAVGDFAPARTATQKIKKGQHRNLTLTFTPTPDVLYLLGKRKKNQVIVGFSLETEHLKRHAFAKLRAKNLDFIVANRFSRHRVPFGSSAISGMVISRDTTIPIQAIPKQRLARIILDTVEKLCYSLNTRQRRCVMRKSKQAFTLIELLVVMAVIALLAGFILPSFGKAREQGRRSQCMNNLKQIGLAIETYRVDHADQFPADLDALWNAAAPADGYIDTLKVFACPSTGNAAPATPMAGDYAWVAGLQPDAASQTLMVYDEDNNHVGGRNELYVDGHVEWKLPAGS